MHYYQVYWHDSYETELPRNLLCHTELFCPYEFQRMTLAAVSAIGGYKTFLKDIEEYLIKTYKFEKIPIVTVNTAK